MSDRGHTVWNRRRRSKRSGSGRPDEPGSPDRQAGERRHLTVMFVDLVGSTEMAERHEPEVIRDVLRQYQELCVQSVLAHRGHVARYEGDGLMVYFGFPVAAEDDARRAVFAGLEILESLGAVKPDLRRDPGIELAARIGVHSGQVLVANIGSQHVPAQDALIGSVPNQAARIQALAGPDELLISDETLDIVRGYFEVESIGHPPMKGIERKVEVFRVVRATGAPDRLHAAGPVRTRLVGRRAELQRMRSCWDAVAPSGPATRSAAMLVRGEAGIGKSRLVETLAAEAAMDGSSVMTAFCASDRQASPLFPILGMAERMFGTAPDDDDALRTDTMERSCAAWGLSPDELVPYLAAAFGVDTGGRHPLPTLDPRIIREQTFQAILGVVRAQASAARALLVVEDLQWADRSTLELLMRLLVQTPVVPLLVLGTARPEFVEWSTTSEVVDIGPLDAPESAELVAELGSRLEVPNELWDLIEARSDGNPLFAEELAKSMAGNATDQRRPVIPRSIRDLLAAKLDALGGEKRLAQIASVVGREVDTDLLRSVAGITKRQLATGLGHLVAGGVLEPIRSERVGVTHQFVHALVRDAGYESQEPAQVRATHRAIADVLSARPDPDAGLVAQHLDAAHAVTEAIAWYLIAGAFARNVAADAEAVRLLSRGLALLSDEAEGPMRDLQEFNIRVVRGSCTVNMRGYGAPEAAADFRRSLELSETISSEVDVVPATAAIWAYYVVHGDVLSAHDAIETLMERINPEIEAEILCCAGAQAFVEGNFRDARKFLEDSISEFAKRAPGREVSDKWLLPSDPLAAGLTLLGCALSLLGEGAEATLRFDEAQRRARALPDYPRGAFSLAYALSYEAWVAVVEGRYKDAAMHYAETVALAERHGMVFWSVAGTSGEAITAANLGDPRQAVEVLSTYMEAWRSLGAEALLPFVEAQRSLVYAQLGDLDSARKEIDLALETSLRTGERLYLAETYRIRAQIAQVSELGSDEEARLDLLQAIDCAREQGAPAFELRAALDLVALGNGAADDLARVRDATERFPAGAECPELEHARALLTA